MSNIISNEKAEEQIANELFEQFEGIVNGMSMIKNQISSLQQNLKQL